MRDRQSHLTEILAIITACIAVVALAGPGLAQKPFLGRLIKTYNLSKENGKCNLCHNVDQTKEEEPEADNLGVFGSQLQELPGMVSLLEKGDDYKFSVEELNKLEVAVKSIESKDADGDGVTNLEELELGTLPGDPKSMPAKEALAAYRQDQQKKTDDSGTKGGANK